MRLRHLVLGFSLTSLLTGCLRLGTNPADPFEALNRPIDRFNHAVDSVALKPLAHVYHALTPAPVRQGVNNVFNNVNQIPTVANDVLQSEWTWALKDTWRFIINSSMGLGGLFDPASSCSLPLHSNDFGQTLAIWGNHDSPYVVIPLLGPSTLRDAVGLLFNFTLFTPYPYLPQNELIYGLLALRYVDLRAQLLDVDKLTQESMDEYAFIRDAYLQNRKYQLSGQQESSTELLYVAE